MEETGGPRMGGWVGPLAFVEWETRGHQTGTVPMQRSLLKAGCVIRPCKCSNMGTNYTETQAPADKAALCCSWENDSREGRDRADAELAAELSTLEFLSCLQKGGIILKTSSGHPLPRCHSALTHYLGNCYLRKEKINQHTSKI